MAGLITITWTDVTAIAPSMSTVPVSTQTAILAEVDQLIGSDQWELPLADIAAAYAAAHLGQIYIAGPYGAAGPATSESVGSVSRSYAAPSLSSLSDWESTAYGRHYLRLVKGVPAFRFWARPSD